MTARIIALLGLLAGFHGPVVAAGPAPPQAPDRAGQNAGSHDDHGTESDHGTHELPGNGEESTAGNPPDGQSAHEHAHPVGEHTPPSTRPAMPELPAVTEADRAAAFPDVEGHTVHDRAIHWFVLFDQLEWQPGEGGGTGTWENRGWIGQDLDRVWVRTEGSGADGRLESAEAHLMYGRMVAPWWDFVIGVRHEFRPGPGRTWAAIGVQGLAPYWFEIEATAYIGEEGRTQLRLEAEYELLITNRLVLQPLVELDFHGKDDPERRIGSGLSDMDAGLRLRYEVRREFAPYVGIVWNRAFFGTADLARAAADDTQDVRLAVGARVWF